LARLYYGNEAHWLRIYKANPDTLATPEGLQVGIKLRIRAGGSDAE